MKNRKSLVASAPFFYGWVIMAAGTFGIIMTSPGQTYTVSIFIESIIAELGISRSLVSTLYSVGTLIGSFALPFWGRQIDRRGSRTMVVIISVLFGLACIFMGFVQNALMLGLGFVLVRMLGQGSLGLVSQTVINQWWMRKRGMVTGISGLLMSLLGMGIFPTLVYALIAAFEWRMAYILLGLATLTLMTAVGYIFFRNRPEDYQLKPDGTIEEEDAAKLQALRLAPESENWTLGEAIRTRVFWLLVVGLSSFAMFSTGLFFHLVSIFSDRGLDAAAAASVYLPVSLAAAVATLVTGFLFGAVMGATNGMARNLGTVSWPSFFGRANLGSIYGFTAAAGVVGAALGPIPFGFARDILGSYEMALFASAAISILLAITSLFVKPPTKD